jgi:hypothetical protein
MLLPPAADGRRGISGHHLTENGLSYRILVALHYAARAGRVTCALYFGIKPGTEETLSVV